jgi:hypothetical protein
VKWWWLVAVGLAAAVPTLLWALDGAGFLHDDWGIASGVEFGGVWDTIESRSTGSPARPLSALYYGLTYGVLGARPVPHLLLLAALNGAATALLVVAGSRLVGRRLALWTTLVWVALPNRGSTRLWVAMGPAVLALCLLLVGVLLLVSDRPMAAGAAMASGVLAYESIVAVAAAGLALWAWRSPAGSVRRAAVPAGLVAAAGGWIFAMSPKRDGGATPFSHAANIVAAQFGRGVFGPLAQVGALLVLVAFAVALARGALPSFRVSLTGTERCVLAGAGLVLLGAAPFFVAGFPFATDGIFDRGNLVPGLGTALILGALLSGLARLGGGVGLVAAAGVVGYVAAFNTVDLRDYRQAVREGELLQARIDADLPVFDRALVVGPPLPNRGGVAQFIAYGDLGAALRLRRQDPSIRARIAVSDNDFVTAGEPLRYNWVERGVSAGGAGEGRPG